MERQPSKESAFGGKREYLLPSLPPQMFRNDILQFSTPLKPCTAPPSPTTGSTKDEDDRLGIRKNYWKQRSDKKMDGNNTNTNGQA